MASPRRAAVCVFWGAAESISGAETLREGRREVLLLAGQRGELPVDPCDQAAPAEALLPVYSGHLAHILSAAREGHAQDRRGLV